MIYVRKAKPDEAPLIQKMARKYSKELGFVSLPEIRKGIDNQEAHVAEVDGELVGYALFHTRRDGWTTLYSLCSVLNGQGVGSKLLWSLPTPLQLKVTQDNAHAIRFYEKHHLVITGQETLKSGRQMALMKVWGWFIHCQGNNREIPRCAREAGVGYGTRHDNTPFGDIVMLDINWEKYDWQDYLRIVEQTRPIMAMCPDFKTPEQYPALCQQIQDLRDLGVIRIMVCPKFEDAVQIIPADCIIALSVPAKSIKYKGFLPILDERFACRRVHLLGGTPQKQAGVIRALKAEGGVVVSADGNGQELASTYGSEFLNGAWYRPSDKGAFQMYQLITQSNRQIARYLNDVLKTPMLI